MLSVIIAFALAAPPQAPPVRPLPPQAPAVREVDPFAVVFKAESPPSLREVKGIAPRPVAKTCQCSPACVCGCNEGKPCGCSKLIPATTPMQQQPVTYSPATVHYPVTQLPVQMMQPVQQYQPSFAAPARCGPGG